ncbi:TIGR03086 family metal-binding protein [Actinokineospora sp. HUAS TT18]|uniref:TIGR03086 family metal-binding protein n=1 Tax=Actinokineospora sp. HUAS TT18 TaxID=3447451 RepID=UPI003F51B703
MNTTEQLTWRAALASSHTALETVVAAVRDDQWDLPTPCSQWSVTQVVQHAAGDQLAYAATLGHGDGPAYDPFAPSGTIDGSPFSLVSTAIERTADAWALHHADTAPTPLPQGELPVTVAAGACALDAAVHAWDIAIATGQPSPLYDQLSAFLLMVAKEIVEPLRQWGAYAAAGTTDSDSATDQLLRYLGR